MLPDQAPCGEFSLGCSVCRGHSLAWIIALRSPRQRFIDGVLGSPWSTHQEFLSEKIDKVGQTLLQDNRHATASPPLQSCREHSRYVVGSIMFKGGAAMKSD